MSIYVEIAALLLSIVILYILYLLLKELVKLLINSVIAVVLLFVLHFIIGLPITAWSLAIAVLSGIPGLLLVVLLYFLGLGV